jgi:putative ABC transport system permease protein
VHRVVQLEDVVAASVAAERFTRGLFLALAGIGLALAATGLYALLSFLVARRGHELGVRTALGATRFSLAGLVVGESLRLAGAGALVGLALAAALTRLMGSQLFDVSPADPLAHAGAALLLALAALLAALQPALRAARVDPTRALRAE